ncbi:MULTISPECIES: tyrosine-type recombinase/integrase [Enterococcus]|jgi:integrase|uniref:Site-specific integrase n=2 Tax=Enterococcus raffinosus TaxID=71452 RepID=A0AAP5K8W3_9ENTE|nr:site-specific integrase [Enterococcus raffinosus]MDT2521729.1 site-specific integrase [Enterococcus raffinosus]MDT2529038.1 site-specific integrase [Enterococcus raffinosus]MDT2532756.1 site-specific integrase [Enterococcus raffinosus]MDT2545525.1 site-specific integrase [Enterococcus raffinosus]MDT2570917.1 site-specific integrase [Enterococcus raffinosus]
MGKRGENIYKRKDGRWEGRYIKGRRENGKIIYGYVYGKSYHEVRDSLYAYKLKYQKIIELHGELAISVKEWIDQWLMSIEKRVKQSTYAGYSHKIKKYILPYIGNIELNQLSTEDLERVVKTWESNGLSPSSIQVVFRILNNIISYAVKKKFISENICEFIELPSEKRKKIRALTTLEQKKLEKEAYKTVDSYGLAVLISLRTGLRIGELSALKWKDINFEENYIIVEHTLQRIPLKGSINKTKLLYSRSKTHTSVRRIPMSKDIKQWLLRRYNLNDTIYVFSNKNKPCEPRLITYHFHKIRRNVGLQHIHFHQLRHTFATRCLESNADIASVSSLLGHASAKMTLDIYADSMMEQRIQTIDNMEKFLA